MIENDCFFCEWIEDKNRRTQILKNELFMALYDDCPVSPGHSLIIPKRHISNFNLLSSVEWKLLQETIIQVISSIESTDLKNIYQKFLDNPPTEFSTWFCQKAIIHPRINTKPDAYNHGINDGRAAGRTIDHLHWHVIPRFDGDMEDPTGGVRNVIPDMGNYKLPR